LCTMEMTRMVMAVMVNTTMHVGRRKWARLGKGKAVCDGVEDVDACWTG